MLPGVKITRTLASQIMMSIAVKENNVSYQSLKQLRFDPLLSHLDLKEIAGEIVTAIHHNKEKMASSLSLTSAVLEKACKTFEDEFSVDGSSFRQATINGLFSTLENASTPAKVAQLRELDLVSFQSQRGFLRAVSLFLRSLAEPFFPLSNLSDLLFADRRRSLSGSDSESCSNHQRFEARQALLSH